MSHEDTGGSGQLEPPITSERIARDLASIGIRPGEILLVHSSLRALSGSRSMVLGGPVAVIEALQATLGPAGTLVMPAFSADYSDPAAWSNPPAPSSWWPTIREHWPAYGADRTPTRGVGVIPETFRSFARVLRSEHPTSSFCAWGVRAEELLHPHPLEDALGEGSPLGRLERAGARVLLLGCDWGSCTGFHLAEHRMARPPPTVHQGSPLWRDGQRAWVEWSDRDVTPHDFPSLGRSFEATGAVVAGAVARATARLFDLPQAVRFAVPWLDRNRES